MTYSLPLAYFLWLISGFGALGLHRYYMRKIPTGILWTCTGGLAMVGAIYDFFTLPRQVEEANLRSGYGAAIGSGRAAREIGMAAGAAAAAAAAATEAAIAAASRSGRRASEPPSRPDSVERIILRTAKKNNGMVTPGELALEGDLSLDEARKALDRMAQAGHAEVRVRASGVVAYLFPEFGDGSGDFIA